LDRIAIVGLFAVEANGGEIVVILRRAIRAVMVGALICMLCFIYLPRCGLRIAPDDVTLISFGLAGVFTFLIYRFS
jgi:hypothetical protein